MICPGGSIGIIGNDITLKIRLCPDCDARLTVASGPPTEHLASDLRSRRSSFSLFVEDLSVSNGRDVTMTWAESLGTLEEIEHQLPVTPQRTVPRGGDPTSTTTPVDVSDDVDTRHGPYGPRNRLHEQEESVRKGRSSEEESQRRPYDAEGHQRAHRPRQRRTVRGGEIRTKFRRDFGMTWVGASEAEEEDRRDDQWWRFSGILLCCRWVEFTGAFRSVESTSVLLRKRGFRRNDEKRRKS